MTQLANLDEKTTRFYAGAMSALKSAEVPFMVGGAYAYACYTGIERNTKDLDLFVKAKDLDAALEVLHEAGYETDLTFPHWLAKAHEGDASVDLIFASGNGLWHIDETWFERSQRTSVFGIETSVTPPEETILMKAFIMERERYDGGDVAHLLRDCAVAIDWKHLIQLFGPHWRVLFSHLVLFGYIYPSKRNHVPESVMREFYKRLQSEQHEEFNDKICRGTLLSRQQYLTDVEDEGYKDGREWPIGSMTENEIDDWTAAIDKED